jgi:hypothetical protein
MVGLAEGIAKGKQARLQLEAAKKAQTAAKEDRERSVFMAQQADWKPEYASDHVAPYQRSESPIADAFLNSFVSGDNASAIQGTRRGAPQMQAQAQQRSDQRFGNMDQLLAKEQQIQQSTPWAVQPFTRQISKPDLSQAAFKADTAGGLNADQMKQLQAAGFKFTSDGLFRTNKSGPTSKAIMKELGVGPDSDQGRRLMAEIAKELQGGLMIKDIKKPEVLAEIQRRAGARQVTPNGGG